MTREIALHCMKSYSELHSDLCELCPIYGQTGSDHCFEDALQYVIGMLKQEPGWIPVSERLPEDYETVIASVGHEYVYPEARYSKEYGWEWAYESGADYWQDLKGVDAWMPLPSAYKRGME